MLVAKIGKVGVLGRGQLAQHALLLFGSLLNAHVKLILRRVPHIGLAQKQSLFAGKSLVPHFMAGRLNARCLPIAQ